MVVVLEGESSGHSARLRKSPVVVDMAEASWISQQRAERNEVAAREIGRTHRA